MFRKEIILPILTFLCLLIIWELITRYSGWSHKVFPSPFAVLQSMQTLISNGDLLKHSVASLFRVSMGFALAVILGLPIGIILGLSKTARYLFNPLFQFLRPISPLAWIPLAMLWFGIGDLPAVFLIFLSSFFPMVVSTSTAVESIKPTFFQVAANFNFSRYETITKIVMPAIIPEVTTALRITITIAWLVVVAAEMIAVQSGLGYMILDSRNALRMDYVMVGMIVIGIIGLLLDLIMQLLGSIESTAWGRLSK
ncbi:MAG: ABC transporter permease [Methylococcales bacterium]|nr:ABC transporter permease [Methylococcales bacterium]